MRWNLEIDSPEERATILEEVRRLEPWYQAYDLADWLQIDGPAGNSVIDGLDSVGFPQDFTGKSVLDLASNAGFLSYIAKLRGAERVVGVEPDAVHIERAKLIGRLLGMDVEFVQMGAHALTPEFGTFDIVICSGLLYHIADPSNVLLRIAPICNETILVESEFLIEPELTHMARFLEGTYKSDETNWWIFGPECMAGMVRAAGFRTAEFTGFYREPHGQVTEEGIPMGGRGLVVGQK